MRDNNKKTNVTSKWMPVEKVMAETAVEKKSCYVKLNVQK